MKVAPVFFLSLSLGIRGRVCALSLSLSPTLKTHIVAVSAASRRLSRDEPSVPSLRRAAAVRREASGPEAALRS